MKETHTTKVDEFLGPVIQKLRLFEEEMVKISDSHTVIMDPGMMIEGNSKMYADKEEAQEVFDNPDVGLLLQYIEQKFLKCGE